MTQRNVTLESGESTEIIIRLEGKSVVKVSADPGGPRGVRSPDPPVQSYSIKFEKELQGSFEELPGSPVESSSMNSESWVTSDISDRVRLTITNSGLRTGSINITYTGLSGYKAIRALGQGKELYGNIVRIDLEQLDGEISDGIIRQLTGTSNTEATASGSDTNNPSSYVEMIRLTTATQQPQPFPVGNDTDVKVDQMTHLRRDDREEFDTGEQKFVAQDSGKYDINANLRYRQDELEADAEYQIIIRVNGRQDYVEKETAPSNTNDLDLSIERTINLYRGWEVEIFTRNDASAQQNLAAELPPNYLEVSRVGDVDRDINWNQHQVNPQNTGQIKSVPPSDEDISEVWVDQVEGDNDILFNSIIIEDELYCPSRNGITSFSIFDGTQFFQTSGGTVCEAGAAFKDGIVVAPYNDGIVYAVNTATESEEWTADISDDPLQIDPILVGDKAFIPSDNDEVIYELDLFDGSLNGEISTPNISSYVPAYDTEEDKIYYTTTDNNLVEYGVDTGETRSISIPEETIKHVVLAQSKSVVYTNADGPPGHLIAVDFSGGSPTIEFTTEAEDAGNSFQQHPCYLRQDDIVIFNDDSGKNYVIDGSDGSIVGTNTPAGFPSPETSNAVVSNKFQPDTVTGPPEKLYTITTDARFYTSLVDITQGSPSRGLWNLSGTTQVHSPVYSEYFVWSSTGVSGVRGRIRVGK